MRKNLPVLSHRGVGEADPVFGRASAAAFSPAVVTSNKVRKMADIEPLADTEQAPDRIPLEEVYMRMAEELAKRSTCARLQVGSVIATSDLTQVLGIGYN